jgi:poly(A) polymerase/tRNA nucleotidyltransferase (CCA-adding enzyme)
MKINTPIPPEVLAVLNALSDAGFAGYIVGGCVRDILMNKEPKDWDVATDATPEQMLKVFPESVYENSFGTVGIKTESEDPKLKIIEATTFRIESTYSDSRHPDEVKFAKTIEEDLSRRDFTMNAIALAPHREESDIIDPFGGQADIARKLIRAVGNPTERFNEDALRMMRAIRFSAQLGFEIEERTANALRENAHLLARISCERIRDEFEKTIMAPGALEGIERLRDYGLLRYSMPELLEGVNVGQNKHHIYTVWEHNVRALEYTVKKNYPLEIRLAALLHDVGKPRTKRGEGPDSTFYHHEAVGATMARKMLERLKFSRKVVDTVTHLVRHHLFYYNVGEVSEAGVRRFVKRVGPENIDDLLKVREADRIGSGVPKAVPYKLRHLLFMIEKVKKDPITPSMLAIDGVKLMELLQIKPGPRVGWILNTLLNDVLDDPARNTVEYLSNRAQELNKLSDKELIEMSKEAKEKKEEVEDELEGEMKKKHRV